MPLEGRHTDMLNNVKEILGHNISRIPTIIEIVREVLEVDKKLGLLVTGHEAPISRGKKRSSRTA